MVSLFLFIHFISHYFLFILSYFIILNFIHSVLYLNHIFFTIVYWLQGCYRLRTEMLSNSSEKEEEGGR